MPDPGAIGGPIVIPNAARVSIVWQGANTRITSCILYGRYAGAFDLTQSDVNAMSTAITSGAAWTALATFLAPTFSKLGVNVQNVGSPNEPIIGAGGSVPGTSPGTALPDECALVVTFRTATTGTSGRGRMYMPGWATNALGAGGVVAAEAVAALQAWATSNIPAMMQAGTLVHCLGLQARQAYTGETGTEHPAREASTIDVSSYIVRDNHWDSQRRRGLH
jgi:hypothetical protein